MKSIQQIALLLFTLFAFTTATDYALAGASSSAAPSYDATVYITSTVYRLNTVSLSGTPTGKLANTTSTIYAPANGTLKPSYPVNGTVPSTGAPTTAKPSGPAFTGAAAQVNVNAVAAILAAGLGLLAL